jgi:hypothetical protein
MELRKRNDQKWKPRFTDYIFTKERERVDKPIQCRMGYGWDMDGTHTFEDVLTFLAMLKERYTLI